MKDWLSKYLHLDGVGQVKANRGYQRALAQEEALTEGNTPMAPCRSDKQFPRSDAAMPRLPRDR